MSQRIKLTWIDVFDYEFVEEVELLSDDTIIYCEDIPITTVYDLNVNMVAFEDSLGIFLVHPEKIINIEVL